MFIAAVVYAQELHITISDAQNQKLIGAQVRLINIADTNQIKFELSDDNGQAKFQNLDKAIYAVSINYIGYKGIEKNIVKIDKEKNFIEFVLKEDKIALKEVSISAKRVFTRQEDDKLIIDPEPIANTSTNSLEILEKTPGIYIDQDGNIYLNSATPAIVYINGREQKMSAQDVATILRSLSPQSILKIEILRTPSAKYDAASSGGIVNVILKKGIKIGRTGSINFSANHGNRGNQSIGFNMSSSMDRGSYYVNTNLNHRDAQEELMSLRYFKSDSGIHQQSLSFVRAWQPSMTYGIALDLNKKWEFSYDARVNALIAQPSSNNQNDFGKFNNAVIDISNTNHSENKNRNISTAQDISFKYKIDTLGSELENKFSYNFNRNQSKQHYISTIDKPVVYQLAGDGINLGRRHFFNYQTDLSYRWKQILKIESGIKSSLMRFNNDALFDINTNGQLRRDTNRTNRFSYNENINAVYLQASKNLIKDLILKVGARVENTNMNGHQIIPTDTSFAIYRVDVFPYVYLSRRIMSIAKHELKAFLIYRKSISRPSYDDLNPYVKYVDQFVYETGNPSLTPQFTENYEANISFEDQPLFALGRNYIRDIITNVTLVDPKNKAVVYRTFNNIGMNRESYFRITGAIPPGGKYFFVVSAQYNLSEYKGLLNNENFAFKRGTWRVFSFHSLSLSKTTKLTTHGFMLINGFQNFYELKNFGQWNMGLQQTLMKGKLIITLSANDILRTMDVKFKINQADLISEGSRYNDSRRIGINLRYSFGIDSDRKKKKTMNDNSESLDSENSHQ